MGTVKLKFPKKLWTKKDTMRLAMNTLASIKLRTSKGLDANGEKFDEYSVKPIYIPIEKGTGTRLKPKGGRVSRTGKSVFYSGGYEEYKHESRKRGGPDDSANVDLVLSGSLMNNLVVLNAEQTRFTIGLTSHVQYYGYYVNEKREFIGLSDKDVDILFKTVRSEIASKINKEDKKK